MKDHGVRYMKRCLLQAVQDLTFEALDKISNEEDPWLLAFFHGVLNTLNTFRTLPPISSQMLSCQNPAPKSDPEGI